MDVLPGDVKRYGSSAAIVLSTLREQGCSATVPTMIQYAEIGRLCGLDYRAVSRALAVLTRHRVVRVGALRNNYRLPVRLVHCGGEPTVADEVAAGSTTHGDAEVLSRPPALRRLDSLRSLLELAR